MIQNTQSEEFWSWFRSIAGLLAADVENHDLLRELDQRVRSLDPMLSWEVGPGATEPWQLVISPNLDRDLRSEAQAIISKAPVITGWEFHSARRPKEWGYRFVMERSEDRPAVQVDASGWKFVLLRFPDAGQEILLQGDNLSQLNFDEDERWQAAAIALESILGEELLLEKIESFELVDEIEADLRSGSKPIQQLRETVVTS